jgi:hypothetical protein
MGAIAALATAAAAWAQSGSTVAEIIELVRSGAAHGRSDGSVAKAVRKLKPSERLEFRVVEELESEGAGPKTVAELELLSETSRALRAPDPAPPFGHDPAPSPDVQKRIVDAARTTALSYSQSLPDFICMQRVRRFDDQRGDFHPKDTLEVKLSYFGRHEEYELLSKNGRSTSVSYREVGGAVSEGEFGSTLLAVFTPASRTQFRWDHWTTLRGRAAHVFFFHIALENSTYRLQFRAAAEDHGSSVLTGQLGFVYVDAATNRVVRIVAETDDIPADFPVRRATTLLDYGFLDIAGQPYLLPLRADVRMATDFVHTRNLVEFHDYRKFAGDATITFH